MAKQPKPALQRKPNAATEPAGMTAAEFKALQESIGLTDDQLCERIDYKRRQIARFKSGEAPIPYLVRFAMRLMAVAK